MPPDPASSPPADDPQREMLAKLIAEISTGNRTGKYSPEHLWALQAKSQWPVSMPPPPDAQVLRAPLSAAQGDPNTTAPMRLVPAPDPRLLRFPLQGEPRPGEDDRPFPGATSVEDAGPYVLPKTAKSPQSSKKVRR